MRVAAYARVSTEEQASEGVSLAAQREKLIAYAKLYDLEVIEVIEDAGQSAKTLKRAGLRRALKLLRCGGADGLLVAKLDRLTRSVADLAKLIAEYFDERRGKSLLSVADQVDTRTAGGRLVLNVLVSVAQWEREAIAERTRDALRHKKAQGIALGQAPLGYRRGESGALVEDAAELAVVARTRELHAGGRSLRQIAAQLTEEGMHTKRGGAWRAGTIAKLLART